MTKAYPSENTYSSFRCRLCFLLLILLHFLVSTVSAQQLDKPVNVETLTVEDGLSQGVVYGMAQDSKGFIWIATFNGLDRYDGNGFLHFRHDNNNPFSISSSLVYSVFEDSKKRLWVGTYDNGLNYYDKETRRFYSFLPGYLIRNIVEDKAGNLFVTNGVKIIRVTVHTNLSETKSVSPFHIDTASITIPDYYPNDNALGCLLSTDSYKHIFATTQTGLHEVNADSTLENVKLKKLLAYRFCNISPTFLQDRNTGNYYLSGPDGLYESSYPHMQNAVKIHEGISFYGAIFLDNKSRLWYTRDNSLYYINLTSRQDNLFASSTRYPLYQFANSTPKLQDKNGTLWLSTYSKGVLIYSDDENNFHSLLSGNNISSVKEAGDNIIIADDRFSVHITKSGAGIAKFEVKGFNQYLYLKRRDRNGNYWLVKDTNIICLNAKGNAIRTIPIPYRNYGGEEVKLPSDGKLSQRDTFYFAIDAGEEFLDKEADLWMHCSEGYLYFDTQSDAFTFIKVKKSKNGFYEDGDGLIWARTEDGICCLNKKGNTVRYYNWMPNKSNQFFTGRHTTAFCDDPSNPHRFLWVGTRSGLSRLEKSTGICLNFSDKNGLPDNLVYSILPDARENIWISTNKGLSRIHCPDLNIRNFDVADGLQGNEFNHTAAEKMKEGTLVFGGTNGLTYFNPTAIKPIEPPQTVITDCKLFGKSIKTGEPDTFLSRDIAYEHSVDISYDDNVITFAFAGIDYRKKNALCYRYKLIGFDKGWTNGSIVHEATYTNLDPGYYTFVAQASNANGIWGKESEPLHLHVLPLWWQTLWFKILAVAAACGLVYLLYRYRLQKALEVERVRNAIARNLHDEIGSTLSAITIYSKVAHEQSRTKNSDPEPLLKKINENAMQVMDAMSDIIWSVSTRNDDFESMVIHMREHAAHLLGLKGYEVHFSMDDSLTNYKLTAEKRQNFYLIFKEALNNIAKYAAGKHVWIVIAKEKNNLSLLVKDDGIGFDCTKPKTGNGLQNMRVRAASIGGSLLLNATPGFGSQILLLFPL